MNLLSLFAIALSISTCWTQESMKIATNATAFYMKLSDCDMLRNNTSTNESDIPFWGWPNKTIPFALAPNLPEKIRAAIVWAMNRIESESCVRFNESKNPFDVGQRPLHFVSINCKICGTASRGFDGVPSLPNAVFINTSCDEYTVEVTALHELLHALAFTHEHQRFDRDDYLVVNENWRGRPLPYKINPSHDPMTKFGIPYDYHSIMHYRMGLDFVRATKEGINLAARRSDLSEKDILKLNLLYNCSNTSFATKGDSVIEGQSLLPHLLLLISLMLFASCLLALAARIMLLSGTAVHDPSRGRHMILTAAVADADEYLVDTTTDGYKNDDSV